LQKAHLHPRREKRDDNMKKYSNILNIFLIVFCFLYFYLAKQLPHKVAVYPFLITAILGVLTLVHIIQTFMKKEEGKGEGIFENFQGKQFLFVITSCFAYVFVVNVLGFFTATFIYLMITLVGLRVNKYIALITTIGFCIGVYFIFCSFLKVPLPKGFII
jgi:putative tricarboxylic transport membrane protein